MEELQFKLRIIDHYCPFSYLLQYRSSEYSDLYPDSYIPGNSVYCPFHENTESKAAKLYPKDTDPSDPKYVDAEKIYCFAENKMYLPHSLLTPPHDMEAPWRFQFKAIVPYTPQWVFNAIWNNLSSVEKREWENTSTVPLSINQNNDAQPLYVLYRQGKISLFDLLSKLS